MNGIIGESVATKITELALGPPSTNIESLKTKALMMVMATNRYRSIVDRFSVQQVPFRRCQMLRFHLQSHPTWGRPKPSIWELQIQGLVKAAFSLNLI